MQKRVNPSSRASKPGARTRPLRSLSRPKRSMAWRRSLIGCRRASSHSSLNPRPTSTTSTKKRIVSLSKSKSLRMNWGKLSLAELCLKTSWLKLLTLSGRSACFVVTWLWKTTRFSSCRLLLARWRVIFTIQMIALKAFKSNWARVCSNYRRLMNRSNSSKSKKHHLLRIISSLWIK